MKNSVKVYVDKFEEEERYDNLLYRVIEEIQNKIESSISNGKWNKEITYEVEELKDYDDVTIKNIIHDLYQYDGEDFQNEGFDVNMKFDGYILTYRIEVATYNRNGYINYDLVEKLLHNGYLNTENIKKYVKAFGNDKTIRFSDEFVPKITINDKFQNAKVTFFVGNWGWEHTFVYK